MRVRDNQIGVTLSILDRLTDLEPDLQKEPGSSSWQDLRELKRSLCRDLADLLNTRRAEEEINPTYENVSNSLLTFGVVDFTSYNLTDSIEQEIVRRSIERAIRQFEPRLTRVKVTLEPADALRPVLVFQIDAVLKMDPASEAVLFDVILHRDSRRMSVSGASV